MIQLSAETISLVAGLGLTNIASILGFFVSNKVQLAELKIMVGRLKEDVDALNEIMRSKFLQTERND